WQRPIRLRRARQGRLLDRPPLGKIFQVRASVPGWLPGGLSEWRGRHQGDGNRPRPGAVPRFSPAERDRLVEAMGDQAVVRESPWNSVMPLVVNTKHPPFDDVRVRRALSLGIDRWHAAQTLSDTTFLKYVGGLMRPGTAMSASEAELLTLPGFSRD